MQSFSSISYKFQEETQASHGHFRQHRVEKCTGCCSAQNKNVLERNYIAVNSNPGLSLHNVHLQ